MQLLIVFLGVLLGSVQCLDLEHFYSYLRDAGNSISVECKRQKAAFLQGLIDGDSWAAKSKENSLFAKCIFVNMHEML